MIQQAQGQCMTGLGRNIVFVIGEITDHFIDTVNANCRKVIAQLAQITARIREKPIIHQTLHHFPFDFQTVLCHVRQIIQTGQKSFFIPFEQIAETRTIDRHHTNRASLFR